MWPFAARDHSKSKNSPDYGMQRTNEITGIPQCMKGRTMKTDYLSLTLMIAMTATVPMAGTAYAATPSHNHEEAQHAQAQTKHEGYGVFKAVNTEAGKVQIAHQPIDSLGWPAMTMWFALRGPLPQGLKAGDAVRFELAQENGKQWVIVAIKLK
ncbi:MAG TPA: hypothetical protein DFK12_09395 [Gallionellaceae bacterium]|nr:hypothetical protein [Gallionellaceae bacterium]